MHEYLTIENLLKRYLVTFTIQIQATGTYWVFEMRQICQICLFYLKAQLVPNIRLLLFGDRKFQKSCCRAHFDKEIHYWILAVLWYLLNLVLICYFGQTLTVRPVFNMFLVKLCRHIPVIISLVIICRNRGLSEHIAQWL